MYILLSVQSLLQFNIRNLFYVTNSLATKSFMPIISYNWSISDASLSMHGEGDKIKFLMGYSGCPHSAAQLISSTAWCYRRFIKRQQITLRPIDFSKARIKHWPRVAIDSLLSNTSVRVERHGLRFFTRSRENHEIFTANCYKRIEYCVTLCCAAFSFFLLCCRHYCGNTVPERVIELQQWSQVVLSCMFWIQ